MKHSNSFYKSKRFILTVVKLLELYFLQSGQLHYAERLIEKFYGILQTRGKLEAIRFCKESRNSIYQWLTTIDSLDKNSRSSPNVALPRHLRFLKYAQSIGHPVIRLVLSALYISRGIEVPPVIDTNPITWASKEVPRCFGKYANDFWDALGYPLRQRVPKSVYWRRFHLSTKTGPNGQALWSSLADLHTLPDSLIESISVVGGERLKSRMSVLKKYPNLLSFFGVAGGRYRKVSAISDYEGKTREVAILDYWSQTALRGLHQYLFNVLRRIPQDCTFNQGGFKDKIDWHKSGHRFHSVDLTRATDRFPIDAICQVLECRLGKYYVDHWRNIMVGYPFEIRMLNGSKESISYNAGNPMGAYSSWNSFALAHHYVVYFCCRELGIKWQEAPYVLLGDDIVIKHDALAQKYMEVMTSLGVEFSVSKSHISFNVCEFAKRTFYLGVEITPFPVAALWSTRKTPSLALNVMVNEQSKGWTSPLGSPVILSELYRLRGFNATFVAKKRKIFHIAHQVMMGISGRITAPQVVKSVTEVYYPDVLKYMSALPFGAGDRVAEFWFMKMFRESLLSSVASDGTGKGLGLIAEQLVCLITGCESMIADACDLIMALPVLQIHGQVEETYMAVVKGGDEQMRLALAKDWKNVLRTLTIPVSDQVYISRNQELMIHASFTLAKGLRKTIEEIRSPKDLLMSMSKGLKRPF